VRWIRLLVPQIGGFLGPATAAGPLAGVHMQVLLAQRAEASVRPALCKGRVSRADHIG